MPLLRKPKLSSEKANRVVSGSWFFGVSGKSCSSNRIQEATILEKSNEKRNGKKEEKKERQVQRTYIAERDVTVRDDKALIGWLAT